MDIKLEIAKLIENEETGLSLEEIVQTIEVPKNKEMGDYAFPCFRLAKTFRKAPNQIASDLADKLEADFLDKAMAVGPYVNFFVDNSLFAKEVIVKVLEQADDYGKSDQGQGKHIVIDYSSTNIAKPFHIGHIRSTVQGDAIKRIYNHLGYETVAINYLGDYGTQFGILLAAYEKWGDKDQINQDPIKELLKLYVRYNELAEEDQEAMDVARAWFRRLEDEDQEALEVWNWFKQISIHEFNRVYDLLGIEFDSYDGEYYHSKFVPDVVAELKEKGLLEESDDAMIVSLEEFDMPPAIILKRDGSSTYITRDIATALKRYRDYHFEKNIYVVGTQQNLHFQQLIKLIEKMGYDWADKNEHVAFGMISLKDGTMSTRKGQVVFLEDVLNQSIQKTLDIMNERNPDLEDKKTIAKQVGIGAIKFQELFNNRIKDYVFEWDQVLNFDGETGPYVQYSHARANSLINRYGREITSDVDFKRLSSQDEKDLITAIYNLPAVIDQAGQRLEPSMVTRQLVEIAKTFNKFYNSSPIFKSDEETQAARMALVKATLISLRLGLNLLGIDAPERM